MTLEVMWANRLYKLLDAYATHYAEEDNVAPVEYTDENLSEAKVAMDNTMLGMNILIQRIMERTSQLPVVGDKLTGTPEAGGCDAQVVERIFYTPLGEPDILGVVYFLDMNQYDYLAEYVDGTNKEL